MRQHIEKLVLDSLNKLKKEHSITVPENFLVQIERTRDTRHGEFATNIAMILAKTAGIKPRELASIIIENFPTSTLISDIQVAGPGFINFFLSQKAYLNTVKNILKNKHEYGLCDHGKNCSIHIEFVSANPTGPLHVGHGRGAAYGAALANLLIACGYEVVKEYYINDAGRQMDMLTLSILFRYLELCGKVYPYPDNAYQGNYIRVIAKQLHNKYHDTFVVSFDEVFSKQKEKLDPELQLDLIINHAKTQLDNEKYNTLFNYGLTEILQDIRNDLEEFGVAFDNWFSEQSIISEGLVTQCIEKLSESGNVYEKNGAKWFHSRKFGDEKDRVVERQNGQATYFASDIAYHKHKFDRKFSKIINIWGADHHGYISRVKGALKALGEDPQTLEILLVQFANLYRGKQKLQMSTRAGEYVTLRELRNEVGNDAARYFYIMRKSEQHLDFDLELAKSHSNDNPVYYIQYAHARVCSVVKQLQEKGYVYDQNLALRNLELLTESHEKMVLTTLSRYPEIILESALKYEPHQLGFYLRDLANDFHAYYNTHQFLVDDINLRNARMGLILSVRQVIHNGLQILGVSAPEKM